jgi:hypothetical protein
VVATALDVRGAQGVGLACPVFQLGGDGEDGLDGERGEGADEQLPDPVVPARPTTRQEITRRHWIERLQRGMSRSRHLIVT